MRRQALYTGSSQSSTYLCETRVGPPLLESLTWPHTQAMLCPHLHCAPLVLLTLPWPICIYVHITIFSPSLNIEFLEDKTGPYTSLSLQDLASDYLVALSNYLWNWTNLKGNEK